MSHCTLTQTSMGAIGNSCKCIHRRFCCRTFSRLHVKPPTQMLFWLVTQSFLVGEERLHDEPKECLHRRLGPHPQNHARKPLTGMQGKSHTEVKLHICLPPTKNFTSFVHNSDTYLSALSFSRRLVFDDSSSCFARLFLSCDTALSFSTTSS